MEGIMTTILGTLNYIDIPITLNMITTMSGDQSTIRQLKEELEIVKKFHNNMTEKLENSEDIQKASMRTNNKIKIDATNMEQTILKEINDWKAQQDEERKLVDHWEPQVNLSGVKLDNLLPMGEACGKTCTSFSPL